MSLKKCIQAVKLGRAALHTLEEVMSQLSSRVSQNDTSVTPRYEVLGKMIHSIYEDTW